MDDSLTSFIEEVCGDSHLRVEDDLGDGFVRLRTSEAERRQAKHDIQCSEDVIIEMLRNARDAHARNIFIALSREGMKRRICMIDDGDGIPQNLQAKIFEPRVTSKLDSMQMDKWGVHGRGMALFSIKTNVETAEIAYSEPGKGTSFVIVSDLETLPEKSDQSSMPSFSYDESGELIVRGPHNTNRCIAEFAFESKDSCNVFAGSAADVVATLYLYGELTLSKSERTFCADVNELPVVKRFSTAADPLALKELSEGLGLTISERTARRILDGDIKALDTVEETIIFSQGSEPGESTQRMIDARKKLFKDARGLKIHTDDLQLFSHQIQDAFKELAQNYYLEGKIEPEIRVSSDSINIKIPINKMR